MKALLLAACCLITTHCTGDDTHGISDLAVCSLDEVLTLSGDSTTAIRLESAQGQVCVQLLVHEITPEQPTLLAFRLYNDGSVAEQNSLTLLWWDSESHRYWAHVETVDYFVEMQNGVYQLTGYDTSSGSENIVLGPIRLTR
ncbi:MAG: hypothetical protein JKY56_18780 [Kofleriaceae bacterium]|nr:hypothetical protein [Kofleriaceae bacterium]